MAHRLCERTILRRGLTPRSYEVTARLAVDAVWAISGSSRQIFAKAFEPVGFAARLGPKWPGDIIAVSFAVHRTTAGAGTLQPSQLCGRMPFELGLNCRVSFPKTQTMSAWC